MNGLVRTAFIILTFVIINSEGLTRHKRIVGGWAAAKPPEDDPVVYVSRNNRVARIRGIRDPNKGFYVFRGIRFGQPPVGRNRFQRPVPVRLEGEINATKWAPPCPQPSHKNDKVLGSEDCLFLNVFTPMLPDSGNGYPVLIWIHGGGFRRGSACQYEMRNLIKKRLIVVSIQYRLGSLGFLSTGGKELPGNYAMMDMMLAVNWVKDNIEYFGGNPKNIIAFGHGTGASAALMLSLSKLSKNVFSGLIAMSGSVLSHFAFDKDPLKTAQYIASKNNCPINNTIEMVHCLRELSVETLIRSDSTWETARISLHGFISGLSMILGPGPVIDGPDDERSLPNFITEPPEESLKSGRFPSIPLLTGVMKNEMAGAIFGGYREEVENKLRYVPNFLNGEFIPTLQSTVSNFDNKSQFVPEAFSRYLNVFKHERNTDTAVIAEAMGDSLYNVPAFLTVSYWAKKTNAFLYSFDHVGNRNDGKYFLAGLPIANAKGAEGVTSHGDDLAYIFGQNTISGEELGSSDTTDNAEDQQVANIFTNMIADFAKNNRLNTFTLSGNEGWLPQTISPFSTEANSFVSITSAPQMMNNFRYCEIGLWMGMVDRLQSSTCGVFRTTLNVINTGANTIGKPIEVIGGAATEFIPNTNVENGTPEDNENGKGSILHTGTKFLPKLPGIPFQK